MMEYLAARVFGILEVAAAVADFELDFSASSPLSESESLLSEESDESLETKMNISIMRTGFFYGTGWKTIESSIT